MYTFHEQRPEYKEFIIKGYIPTQDQHQRLAEQFITGGYDSLVYQPGDLHTCPKSSIEFIRLYKGLKKLSIGCCNILDIYAIAEYQPAIDDLYLGLSSSKKNLSFLRSMMRWSN